MGITPIVDQNSVHFFSLLVCLFEIPVLTNRFRDIWILLLKQKCWALLLARALCHETIVLRAFASWTAIAMQRFSYQTVSPDFGRWRLQATNNSALPVMMRLLFATCKSKIHWCVKLIWCLVPLGPDWGGKQIVSRSSFQVAGNN